MEDENFSKIYFELDQDENGYPPDKWETLWAKPAGPDLYEIDNIPFYVKGISSGDLVLAEEKEGVLHFKRLVKPSGNSVFRLYLAEPTQVQAARDEFRQLKCESELSNLPRLIAVEIPNSVDFLEVGNHLTAGSESGRWDYEEGVLRHKISE